MSNTRNTQRINKKKCIIQNIACQEVFNIAQKLSAHLFFVFGKLSGIRHKFTYFQTEKLIENIIFMYVTVIVLTDAC